MTLLPKSPEPTAVGAVSSAVAVHVTSRRWLSFLRSRSQAVAANGQAGVVRQDAIGFLGEEIAFPSEEFALPGKEFGFPGERFAFRGRELRFPGEELRFPGVEFAFPAQVLTIPGARKGRF